MSTKAALTETGSATVVLLHGLGAGSWFMALLARRLQLHGYHVRNWGYWSFGQSLEKLIPAFEERFAALQEALPAEAPLHIVGHSMGSIIARTVISEVDLPALRRVVMLCPPNAGSRVATNVGRHLRWLTPMVDELADREDSLVNRLPKTCCPQAQIGVIAAGRDLVVHVDSTHLPQETDHIIMPSGHSTLVLRQTVAEQVVHFLDSGTFLHPISSENTPTAPATPAGDAANLLHDTP